MPRRTYAPKPAHEVKTGDIINASRNRNHAEVLAVRPPEADGKPIELSVQYGARVKRFSTVFYGADDLVEVAQ